ncbi:MAG: S41 family peptidase [Clostridia bacterium]|nr:S41 family peptidase [Clostridia bacterium]
MSNNDRSDGRAPRISLGMAIMLVLLAVLVTFQITTVSLNKKYSEALDEFTAGLGKYQKLMDVEEIYNEFYIGELDEKEITDNILRGYIYGTGDKYAYYLSAEEFAENEVDTSAEYVGIGVRVMWSMNTIEVINVMPDSPALEAGILPGDYIVAVEGDYVSEIGYDEALDRMLGDVGTNANFTVQRNGETIEFSVVREKIKEISVISSVCESDPTVGIIQILEFDLGTPGQFKAACEELQKNGAERFVFDVRNNPGGNLDAICDILDYLLPEGPIVHIVYKSGEKETISSDDSSVNLNCSVIINENTASAGELFASALQDYDYAKLVGTTTYGKGTMQNIIPLSDGSGFGISTALYYPPYSENYEGVGVQPDYPCEIAEEFALTSIYKLTFEQDAQLQKAIEILDSAAE